MLGLLDHPGAYRRGGVGVMGDGKVLHMAPQANRVPRLMGQLFDWLGSTREHPLIASSVFHYEFEFIHPFADGNGRMGRLWQTLLLSRWQPAFAWLPVESLVHQQQGAYYQAINASTRASDSAAFIHFMLGCILDAVGKAGATTREETRVKTQVEMRVKTPQQILAPLREHPAMTLDEVAVELGRAVSTIERAVAKLQAEQRLRFEGPKKGGR
jgi:Fic family protein